MLQIYYNINTKYKPLPSLYLVSLYIIHLFIYVHVSCCLLIFMCLFHGFISYSYKINVLLDDWFIEELFSLNIFECNHLYITLNFIYNCLFLTVLYNLI